MSDTLQGREDQLKVKEYMKEIEKKREQYYHEETLVTDENIIEPN